MALQYQPYQRQILICDFDGLRSPEMLKRRLVIVLSPKPRRFTGLCTVVPLSTTAPHPPESHHFQLRLNPEMPRPFNGGLKWVKGDMIYTVSLGRLDRPHHRPRRGGGREYIKSLLPPDDFLSVQACVKAALGFT